MSDIPRDHPRYHSLMLRERLVAGLRAGLTSEAGLIAHGRGEAFDYLIGERTRDFADEAIAETSRLVRAARKPVFSVNGNSAALAAEEIVALAKGFPALTLEVNLFHHSAERSAAIAEKLRALGAPAVVESGTDEALALPTISSPRRRMHPAGLGTADVVVVALEDGDRTQALVDAGRTVVAIDLNPLSRTGQTAHVTIVDELTRAVPLLLRQLLDPSPSPAGYNNRAVLDRAVAAIRGG